MVNGLADWISRIATTWKFWCVVPPWEVGIRVRLGRQAESLLPGPHWRIPVLDQIFMVNTRERYASTPTVTLPCSEGNRVRCVRAIVGYRLTRPLLAIQTYEHPSVAVMARTQSCIAADMPASMIEESLREEFKSGGIEISFVRFSEDVNVPALRVMQADWGIASENFSQSEGRY